MEVYSLKNTHLRDRLWRDRLLNIFPLEDSHLYEHRVAMEKKGDFTVKISSEWIAHMVSSSSSSSAAAPLPFNLRLCTYAGGNQTLYEIISLSAEALNSAGRRFSSLKRFVQIKGVGSAGVLITPLCNPREIWDIPPILLQ